MVRILIAHTSRLVSDSLRNALDKQAGVSVVGCAATHEEVEFLLPHANIVLIEADFGGDDFFKLLCNMHLTHPQVKALVIGVANTPATILSYIEAGAAGFVTQSESLEEMLAKVVATQERKAFITPAVAALMMERLAQLSFNRSLGAVTPAKHELVDQLTDREREVLDLISENYTNKEIAAELFIECGTVKNHVHNILTKLEVSNRHEAVRLYQAGSKRASTQVVQRQAAIQYAYAGGQ